MRRSDIEMTVDALQKGWVWVSGWQDRCDSGSAGRIVTFTRRFQLGSLPKETIIHCTADTRYKLWINGVRVNVGPTRSSTEIWYYDTIDIAPFLRLGENTMVFEVLRYFFTARAAFPFARTAFPGLTVVGTVEDGDGIIDLSTLNGWNAEVESHVKFPMGLIDDVFLHINERVVRKPDQVESAEVVPYGFKTVNGDLAPWRLRPRLIPLPAQTPVKVDTIRSIDSADTPRDAWQSFLTEGRPLTLPPNSTHQLDLQAECHSTAFIRWTFRANRPTQIRLKLTYSEGYELTPRLYPWLRTKADRLDAVKGQLLGPFDEVVLDISDSGEANYEPFWFRTFRLLRVELSTGPSEVELVGFEATQTNYPLDVKAVWQEPGDEYSERIWDVCIRTMRNCMFDGYSDCPFYEQLQYAGDSRSVGLFHYYLSGDDRLMRQAIVGFAASITPDGLTQSRYPSHVPQVIAGFSLFWVLEVCDHMLWFGDIKFVRPLLSLIDGVFEFYNSHVDELGLVSGLPKEVWQYVDWVNGWEATDDHPDKGVPTSGRKSNRHTYFSMLYAYTLRQAAQLLRHVGRTGLVDEYESRADDMVRAIRKHCYDGRFFTDSTADIATESAYTQHCQVFGVLCGAADPSDSSRLLLEAFDPSSTRTFGKCSYVMMFYAFRAFAKAGDSTYNTLYASAWEPWRGMIRKNLSTWEEDDVRERSDCHAWGSVAVYEYCAEVAGLQPLEPGWNKVLFAPRLSLSDEIHAKVALGSGNVATVDWKTDSRGKKQVSLKLEKPVAVVVRLPGGELQEKGVVAELDFSA